MAAYCSTWGPTVLEKTGGFIHKKLQYTNQDIRYTMSKDGKTVYGYVLATPENVIQLNHVQEAVQSFALLGSSEPLTWTHNGPTVEVEIPDGLSKSHA